MKRITTAAFALLLTVLTVFSCNLTAMAQLIFPDTTAPQLSLASCLKTGEDCEIQLNVFPGKDAVEAEQYRLNVYNTFKKTLTESELSKSEVAWCQFPFTVHFEVSTDAKTWIALEKQCAVAENGKYTFSVISDALAVLTQNNAPITASSNALSLYIRAYTAPTNCTRESNNPSILSPLSKSLTIKFDSINLIVYDLDGGKNSPENPPAYYTVTTAIRLAAPTRPGYLFKGWSDAQGNSVGEIPAGSAQSLHFKAKWEAKRYSVYYVLSQPSFKNDFSTADNKANPRYIFADKSAPLADISSPHSGYVLGGWYETADFSTPALKEIPVGTTHDIKLYAEWITYDEKVQREDAYKNTALRLGDVDNDGKVSSADARLTLRHVVKLESIDAKYIKRADFFKTGIISAACARTVLRLAVELDNAPAIMSLFGITYLD